MHIKISELRKIYGGVPAVEGVSFECLPGTITGFLGPNGAGKTTVLRMMADIASKDAGDVYFDGQRYADIENPASRIGLVLDAAAFHPGRSVRETLCLTAMVVGVTKVRVDDILESIGLSSVAKRRVKQLSLGMRQRLAIGSALLSAPRCLILDEPANGLDADGTAWIRSLLMDFAGQGGTVLISSHMLREVQATADQIVMIDRGKVVAQGRTDSFTTSAVTRVVPLDAPRFGASLDTVGWNYRQTGEAFAVAKDSVAISRLCIRHELELIELTNHNEDALEDSFMSLTSGEFATDKKGGIE